MREILFRGKNKDDEWVEGFLFKYKGKYCVAGGSIIGDDYGLYSTCYDKVIPETIGQYTGLTDKNGKKIFEGDIIKCRHEWSGKNRSLPDIVDLFTMPIPTYLEMQEEFEEQKIRGAYGKHTGENDLGKRFYYYRNYVVEYYAPDGKYRLRNGSVFHDLTSSYLSNRNAEVIGNIHDNPELLKGE